jgi:hypothetical protein
MTVRLGYVDRAIGTDSERVRAVELPRRSATCDDLTIARQLDHAAARMRWVLIPAVRDVDEAVGTAGNAPGTADERAAPGRDERAVALEDRDACVLSVGDIDAPAFTDT